MVQVRRYFLQRGSNTHSQGLTTHVRNRGGAFGLRKGEPSEGLSGSLEGQAKLDGVVAVQIRQNVHLGLHHEEVDGMVEKGGIYNYMYSAKDY